MYAWEVSGNRVQRPHVHSWDVARATGQDETMSDGLAAGAYEIVHGRFTDEQRKGIFKPEVPISDDAFRRTGCWPTQAGIPLNLTRF